MDKRVIITGATGFIGRHLVQSLLEDGYPVTALTRNAAKACQILGAEVECLQWDGASPSGWGHRAEN
ncbi:MAG TPA: NAD(P)H-binding protein, partial [Calditrichia bacterium]|nr:NAD(P)H-binding protein [Calditrichia bacterium]